MKQSKKILKNLFSLSVAEAANKGIVFVYNAYLARVILPEGFGIIGFATAYLMYFLLFVNLGFNTVGAREIAKDHSRTNKLVNTILTLRTIIAFVAYAVLFLTAFLLDKPMMVKWVIWISGLNLFANAFLVDWVYHGNEKMEFLALRQVITSVLNLTGIILLVHQKDDVVIAMIVTVISTSLNT
ncbi:MAG: oligosaccharide flippase family protein, partial [Bacteroidota bacterium]